MVTLLFSFPPVITKPAFLVALLALSAFTSLHAQRQDMEVAADWKFIQQDVGASAPANLWTAISLPHTWNALDAQKGTAGNPSVKGGYYRGACWYARTLDIPADWQGRRVFVRFEAASIVAKTYLNGELLGEHRGAFTAFCYELTPQLHFGAKNELRVQVDNSPQRDVPPVSGDFNMDGGLYRPVHLIVTDAVCIRPVGFCFAGRLSGHEIHLRHGGGSRSQDHRVQRIGHQAESAARKPDRGCRRQGWSPIPSNPYQPR